MTETKKDASLWTVAENIFRETQAEEAFLEVLDRIKKEAYPESEGINYYEDFCNPIPTPFTTNFDFVLVGARGTVAGEFTEAAKKCSSAGEAYKVMKQFMEDNHGKT